MKQVYNPEVKTYGTHIKTTAPGIMLLANSVGKNLQVAFSVVLCVLALQLSSISVFSQNCATTAPTYKQNSNENTYYPGQTASLPAGSTSIQLGAKGAGTNFGNTSIKVGDIVLIIQMQGAQINLPANNQNSKYGGNASGIGSGFLSTNMLAGNMEFAVAASAVPVTGGVLNLLAGLTYSYKNAAFGTDGQYTYQIILVPSYYNIQLGSNINTPKWNGSTGGVTVINAVNQLDFNTKTISAVAAGFRGGAGINKTGAAGTTIFDYYTMSSVNANGSKGEGIAGTPRYLNVNNIAPLVDNVVEGYPGGSFAMGAPGNAGGGATDSNPTANDQNAGGGGGGNGGAGGLGGNGWLLYGYSGGLGGSSFSTTSPSAINYSSPSRLIMGGGGGAGDTNNATGTSGAFSSSGATGGGIVIVNALTIIGKGSIDVSGNTFDYKVLNDGSGGGGAGGSILIYANSGLSQINATADGGDGISNYPKSATATQHGPGGGGGGGVIYANGALKASSTANGGNAGTSYGQTATDSFNAQPGNAGILVTSIPFSQLPPNMEICQIQVLPATITDFNASYISSNNVKVFWSTTNEINASYYVVERSTNAEDFTPVGQVNVSQSSNPVHNYTINDQLSDVNSSVIYYRLRIVDQSGKFGYSKIVPVKLGQPETSFSIYPNPVDHYTILNLVSDKQAVGMLRVIDNSGRQMLIKSISVNNGNNSIMVDQLDFLPRGVYMVQVLLNNNLYNQKLLKK